MRTKLLSLGAAALLSSPVVALAQMIGGHLDSRTLPLTLLTGPHLTTAPTRSAAAVAIFTGAKFSSFGPLSITPAERKAELDVRAAQSELAIAEMKLARLP